MKNTQVCDHHKFYLNNVPFLIPEIVRKCSKKIQTLSKLQGKRNYGSINLNAKSKHFIVRNLKISIYLIDFFKKTSF